MLDDQKYIAQIDVQDALGVATHEPRQLGDKFSLSFKPDGKMQNVVIAGMGGSALSAELIKTWPGLGIPYEICRQYEIPAYVSKSTLFIASSYSGDTEETVSAFDGALTRGAQIICLSSGGKLRDLANQHSVAFVELKSGLQPRMAMLSSFKALLTILGKAGVVSESVVKELELVQRHLVKAAECLKADVPTQKNPAKQLAEQLAGKTPIIYAGPKMFPAAYKWKISFNENSKNLAFCNQLPEFNHNEFIGWTAHPVEKPFGIIDLVSSFEEKQIQDRFDVTDKLLSGRRPKAIRVNAKGHSMLEHLLWLTLLGEFTSIYLAILNGVNPTPVELVGRFKKEITKLRLTDKK